MNKDNAIKKIIEDIKSPDPMTFEDAFHIIMSDSSKYKDFILIEYKNERDSKTKGRFIELLGLYKDETLISLFEKELTLMDDETIPWTLSALEDIDSSESLKIVNDFKSKFPEWD